jgi:hypothetical protein
MESEKKIYDGWNMEGGFITDGIRAKVFITDGI